MEISLDFALKLDQQDKLKDFRSKFFFPKYHDKEVIYLNGNSLGLQPKSVGAYLQQELDDWANLGGQGHLKAKNPWVTYHHIFKAPLSVLCGALEHEVTAMNSLTTNLHLLMVSFYRPAKKRYKILMEKGAFSSDMYAVESQVKYHGYHPDDAIIEIGPRAGEFHIRLEDILDSIDKNKDDLSLILFGGVNYYTGQLFDMGAITEAGHKVGASVGFDLAHAIGNVPLKLHDWNVDFAVWCSYKYLNSGPGGVGGAFVHDRWFGKKEIPRFTGWWGHIEKERFDMKKGFIPSVGVDSWQLSNVPILSMAAHKASLDLFMEAGFESLIEKSRRLTGYLEFLIKSIPAEDVTIITPGNSTGRGCQLSLFVGERASGLYRMLTEKGVVVDYRKPDVIRASPVPIYNSFEDVYTFYQILKNLLEDF